MLLMTAAAVQAQTRDTPRLPWGDPDLEGTWTNATLTQLQRPADLGAKAFFTPEEAAAWDKQRIEQTNADRPARPGEVGAYNDAFFERGRGGVKSRRTSLVIDPPDGRIPALTPLAQQKVEARLRREAASPADGPGIAGSPSAASCSAPRCRCCPSPTTTTTPSSSRAMW